LQQLVGIAFDSSERGFESLAQLGYIGLGLKTTRRCLKAAVFSTMAHPGQR
jgi:hypothetical protein